MNTYSRWMIASLVVASLAPGVALGQNQDQAKVETAPPAAQDTDAAAAQTARDSEARHLFEAGRNAYDDGRYEDALDYFQRGYELSQRPQLLYNVGQAADRLRHDQTALDAFKLYLEKLPAAENRPQVEERIRVLDQVLADRRAVAASVAPVSAAPTAATQAEPARHEGDVDDNLLNQWWVWAAVGGVVVVTVVVVVVVAGSGGGGTKGELTPGSNGMTIAALTFE